MGRHADVTAIFGDWKRFSSAAGTGLTHNRKENPWRKPSVILEVDPPPFVLAVTATLPVKNLKDLVDMAKAQPGKLTYASSGSGGSAHLSAETFKIATGTQILHVPYKGGGAAITDLMAGYVDMIFASVLETSGFIKAGKLKALAITSKARVAAMPDVPTLQESGVSRRRNCAGGRRSWTCLSSQRVWHTFSAYPRLGTCFK